MAQRHQGNGESKVTLTPRGATIFLGVLTATLLERVTSRHDLEELIQSLTNYWSIAQERLPGQIEFSAATDEHNVHVLVNALIAHLKGSYDLLEH